MRYTDYLIVPFIILLIGLTLTIILPAMNKNSFFVEETFAIEEPAQPGDDDFVGPLPLSPPGIYDVDGELMSIDPSKSGQPLPENAILIEEVKY